jgi:hypothetical protein
MDWVWKNFMGTSVDDTWIYSTILHYLDVKMKLVRNQSKSTHVLGTCFPSVVAVPSQRRCAELFCVTLHDIS